MTEQKAKITIPIYYKKSHLLNLSAYIWKSEVSEVEIWNVQLDEFNIGKDALICYKTNALDLASAIKSMRNWFISEILENKK
jgi:hypothetical protein